MPNYDFTTLNDKDFEELARDLLNKKTQLSLQSYKSGRDGGIDLRYSIAGNSNEVVVQVKHYFHSGFNMLMSTLKKEVAKVQKLNPARYIIVTSVPLSAANQDEIKLLFEPYIQSAGDVIGSETLNAWLSEYKEVERAHFKLWLSSTEIIDNIVNNAVTGRSTYYTEWIHKRLCYYVPVQTYPKAYESLLKNKILIITGEPGAGKTTLADMLSFQLMGEGYKLFKIESIEEAEKNLSPSPDQKQLFYFDDFLGSIHLDITINNRLTDSSLDTFFKRIRNSKNKLFLLTSRTVILNQGLETFEKFKYAYLDREKTELAVTEYTDLERGKILYNHMYFHGLPADFVSIIKENDFFIEIIRHANFSPRLIEFVTDPIRLEAIAAEDFKQFLLNTLENPTDIWRFSFEKQLNDEQRFLLVSLFTIGMGPEIEESRLQEIYDRRLQYEIQNNNHRPSFDSFQKAMKILAKGFITRKVLLEENNTKPHITVTFINPSLEDFLRYFLISSGYERIRMIASFLYFEQVDRFLALFWNVVRVPKETEILIELLLSDTLSTFRDYSATSKQFRSFWLISYLAPGSKAVLLALEKIDFSDLDIDESYGLAGPLKTNIHNPSIKKIIQLNFDKLIIIALRGLNSYKGIPDLCRLFTLYEKDLQIFFSSEEHIDKFRSRFHSLIESEINQIVHNFFVREKFIEAHETFAKLIKKQTKIIEHELKGYFKLDFEIQDQFEWMREKEDEFVAIVTRYDGYDLSDEEVEEERIEQELRDLFD